MIKLSAPFSGGSTVIPNSFFDIYMPRANGYYVKIYLFLQRFFQSGRSSLSVTEIADTFDLTESDVVRSLSYWEREGLLDVNMDEEGMITRISLIPTDVSGSAQESAGILQQETYKDPHNEDEPAYTRKGSSDTAAPAEETQMLLVIEQYLGHPLGRKDAERISYFHEGLGFSYELIDYLFSYCASIDKKDMNYIEKVAFAWAGAGVSTPAQAKTQTQIHEAGAYRIMEELGLGNRHPAPAEMAYIDTWRKEYGFPSEMILEACRRTVIAVHGPSFAYADTILSTWKELGIRSPEDLAAHDARRKQDRDKLKEKNREKTGAKTSRSRQSQARKDKNPAQTANRFHNFSQRSYDYSELEQRLIKKARKAASPEPAES